MSLTEVCVRRPVFAMMLITFLVVLGIFSFRDLGVDLYPKADVPAVRISVRLPGASPDEINSQITLPIEEAVNTISGLEEIFSNSSEGSCWVFCRFAIERDPEDAAQDVREKVAAVVSQFPQGTFLPVITKIDPDSDPVMSIAVSGPQSLREITEIADKKIKRRLDTVAGVGEVLMVGGRKRQINIRLDAKKMNAYGITIQQIRNALQRENVEIPGGSIEQGESQIDLRTLGRVDASRQFGEIIVANVKGTPLKIADFGYVEDGFEEPIRSLARLDGKNAVTLLLRKQQGTNTVEVINRVKQMLNRIKPELPRDLNVQIIKDQSVFINASVKSLEEHLILGSLFASLIVLIFMRNLRSVIIASIAIPTSIISTFTLMKYMGFTINSVTLLGVTLAVGIVIDDAIVVLENIFRHVEEKGEEPMKAAVTATKEIGLAVMATTLSLVVIFLPVAFMQGLSARYLNSFGWTMAFSIMVSLLVSFTLTPMMCSRFLKVSSKNRHDSKHTGMFSWIDKFYEKALRLSLAHRWAIVLISALTFASTFPLYKAIGQDFIPFDDQSEFDISVRTPEGTSVEGTDRILRQIEAEVAKLRGVKHVLTTLNPMGNSLNEANIYVKMKDLSERDFPQFDVVREARQMLKQFPSIQTSVRNPSMITTGGPASLIVNVRGPDLARLDQISKQAIEEMKKIPGFADVYTPFNLSNPELKVKVDREKAADLGVSVSDVATALRLMVSGEDKLTTYREGDDQYEVRARVLEEQRKNIDVVSQLMVPSTKLGQVRLDNIATIVRGGGPVQISRYNRQYRVSTYINLDDRKPLDEAIRDVNETIRKINLPPGYDFIQSGRVRDFEQTVQGLITAFLLSAIFMYMVLAAQFESLIHPITIMLSLPLSIPFALICLLMTQRTLNLWSVLGILLLLGIVKKNSILQVDYTNTLRQQGMDRFNAIIEANRTRLRPILMTTFSIVAGLIPTAFGKGAGAAQRSAIAVTIIGGQTLCLLLTLLLTPVAYTIFDDIRQAQVFARIRMGLSRLKFALARLIS